MELQEQIHCVYHAVIGAVHDAMPMLKHPNFAGRVEELIAEAVIQRLDAQEFFNDGRENASA